MGFRIIYPKRHRVKKVKSRGAQEVLDRLDEFLRSADVTEEPVEILCRFWEDQQTVLSYKELREAVKAGYISNEILQQWSQDYSYLVKTQMHDIWINAMKAGVTNQPLVEAITSGFTFNTQSPGILSWLEQRGAEFVTVCTQQQKDAVAALLSKKMIDGHTVDELARMIRPCIGLTEGQAKANARYYDSIVANLRKEHPRMSAANIRQKALDASAKYAERQHRERALTIAQTESAFAYNQGADVGIRQAQSQNLIGTVKKRWSTSGDDGVCDICAALEGTEVDMDSDFIFEGRSLFVGQHMLPPAHPRCACAVEYIETEPINDILSSPMPTGDAWIDDAIESYDESLIWTNGDDAMSTRLLMSHDEVQYEKNESLKAAFQYDTGRDVILYNPYAKHATDYDMRFALTHENAHRVDCMYLHSWENKNFVRAMDELGALMETNIEVIEKLLENKAYRKDFALNDLISSLTRGKANDILFIGHNQDYLASDYRRSLEVFADMTCIDMGDSAVREEFNGILKGLYEAYKEVVSWKVPE